MSFLPILKIAVLVFAVDLHIRWWLYLSKCWRWY